MVPEIENMKIWQLGKTKKEVLKEKPDEFYLYIEVTAPSGEIWNVGQFIGKTFVELKLNITASRLCKFLTSGLEKHQRKKNK